MSISIEKVSYENCMMLRHQVLWPDHPLHHCFVEGDELAEHFILKKDGEIISCISVFQIEDNLYQIRKFATDTNHQRLGYGSRLFHYVLEKIICKNPKKIIIDARESASSFYMRFGFHQFGSRFTKNGIFFIKMELTFRD